MKISILAICLSILASGCALFETDEESMAMESRALSTEMGSTTLTRDSDADDMQPYEASAHFQKQYKQKLAHSGSDSVKTFRNNLNPKNRNINHYVRGIMQDLVANMQYVNASTPMVVTSFVFLDSDFSTANLLGNQIAESFMHEIHKFGIPVIDFKTTDYIRITGSGDFVLSRDFLELKADMAAEYVLLGTLTKQQGGMLVNARIVGFESKAIVASAQGFLPSDISNSLLNNSLVDGVKLVSE